MSTQVLGKSWDRVDGKLKVTGRALYAGDHPIKDLAYGFLVRSTIAKGMIRAMDVSQAEKSQGVLAIYTPFNPLKLYAPLEYAEGAVSGDGFPPLQDKKVQYYGQIIGLVVADSFEQARDGAALVTAVYK
jgi:xanthine dehydrogenase YagR molybdenum-binding subunit